MSGKTVNAMGRAMLEHLKANNRAWAERILTSVFVEKHAPHRPEEIVLHSAPPPLIH